MDGRRVLRHRRVPPALALLALVLVLAGTTTAFTFVRRAPGTSRSAPTTATTPDATVRSATPTPSASATPAVSATASATGTVPPAAVTASGTATASATGSRDGAAVGVGATAAASGPYRVVGLGDSVPAGNACECTSYVTLVGQGAAAASGRTAEITNDAESGQTTADLLTQLQDPSVRQAIAAADLVIVTIGANDFDEDAVTDDSCAAPELSCYRSTLAEQATQLSQVLARIAALEPDAGRTLITGYWNVFLDGEVGRSQGSSYVRNSDALTLADNAVIARAGRANGATYVDLYAPFKGDGSRDDTALLADDGDHPNAAGHRLIAATLLSAAGTR